LGMREVFSNLFMVVLVVAGSGCSARREAAVPDVMRMPPVTITNGQPEFRDYDLEVARSIQGRWYDLVSVSPRENYRDGKVVLQFLLHDDGRVTNVAVLENSTDNRCAWLCQKAVMDVQPFLAWPAFMRTKVATNSRRISFTFTYEK